MYHFQHYVPKSKYGMGVGMRFKTKLHTGIEQFTTQQSSSLKYVTLSASCYKFHTYLSVYHGRAPNLKMQLLRLD